MAKNGKKIRSTEELYDKTRVYPLPEVFELLKKISYAKFDETVDVVYNLGIDPTKADQMVRGSVVLPHGVGKTRKVLVFAKGDHAIEAKEAGADIIADDEIIQKIQKEGWVDFDVAIATPDMMGQVGKLGKILGPRGLMPNPKVGTVTFEIAKAVKESKGGKVTYKTDKYGNVHAVLGKKSFDNDKLLDNFLAFYDGIIKAKPQSAKGKFIKNLVVSTTMSHGIKVDVNSVGLVAKERI